MNPKKGNDANERSNDTNEKNNDSIGKEKRKVIRTTIELKKKLITKLENGVRVTDLAKEYNLPKSTISTFFKNKEAIMAADVAKGVTTSYSKQRPQIVEEVEKLLLTWIQEREFANEIINEAIICEKAKEIYNDLLQTIPSTSAEGKNEFTFKASRGWFDNFKHRSGIRSVRVNENANGSREVVEKNESHGWEFRDFVNIEGYVPQQVFNCDKTGLFWKKLSERTHIAREEQFFPGYKPMKDRISILLCSNASGDCKIKPLVVYHSENPRVFRKNKVIKKRLPVMWRSNAKSWCTRQFFLEWLYETFGPQVKEYLKEKQLPIKCLLVLDNVFAHPQDIENVLSDSYNFIKVLFLPSNTVFLQPVYQQVISNFKMLYTKALFQKCYEITIDTKLKLRDFWKYNFTILNCLTLIDNAWSQVTYKNMNSPWKRLWFNSIVEEDIVEFQSEESALVDEIAFLGNSIGLKVEREDIFGLLDSHKNELNAKELQDLQEELQKTLFGDISADEDEGREHIPTALIQDMCTKWGEILSFVQKYHTDVMLANKAVHIFNDTMMHFRKILQQRQNQSAADKLFVKEKRKASPEKVEMVEIKKERIEEFTEEQLCNDTMLEESYNQSAADKLFVKEKRKASPEKVETVEVKKEKIEEFTEEQLCNDTMLEESYNQ